METQFAIVVYRRRWNGFLILLCSLALLFPPPATGSGHCRASLCLSRGPSLYLPPAALEPNVSQAKYALRASCPEVSPGRCIVIKDQRKTPCICMVFFFGIRRLPIFPASAHIVAARWAGRPFLQLPVLEQLRFAASCTAGAHRRCVSSQAIPYGYLDGLVARRDRETQEAQKTRRTIKRGEIRKQAKTLISSRLWTAGKQVTSE